MKYSDDKYLSAFTQLLDEHIILKYLHFTWAFLVYPALDFYFATFYRQILYFVLHCIHLTTTVTSQIKIFTKKHMMSS